MNPKHGGNHMARVLFLGSLAVTVFLYACGTSPVGSNQGEVGGTGGKGAAADGGPGGGAGGSADPCADCKTLDHCCILGSLDGCNSAGGCVPPPPPPPPHAAPPLP